FCCLTLIPPAPRSTPFPYTTLFRSVRNFEDAVIAASSDVVECPELPGFLERKSKHTRECCVIFLRGIAANADRELIPEYASAHIDRKSTRLNSSHDQISYAVFCLKK